MSSYVGDGHEVLKEVLANELDNDTENAVDSGESIVLEEPQEDKGLTIDIPELIKSDEEQKSRTEKLVRFLLASR